MVYPNTAFFEYSGPGFKTERLSAEIKPGCSFWGLLVSLASLHHKESLERGIHTCMHTCTHTYMHTHSLFYVYVCFA